MLKAVVDKHFYKRAYIIRGLQLIDFNKGYNVHQRLCPCMLGKDMTWYSLPVFAFSIQMKKINRAAHQLLLIQMSFLSAYSLV